MIYGKNDKAIDFSNKNDDKAKLTLAAGTVTFPQVESLSEATQFFKGEENLVEAINKTVRASALAKGRNLYLNAKATDLPSEESVIATIRDYVPGERSSYITQLQSKVAEKDAKLDAIREAVENGTATQEMLLELLSA